MNQRLEVVATGETDLEARLEIAGTLCQSGQSFVNGSACCGGFRNLGAPALSLGEMSRSTSESHVKHTRLCELFAERTFVEELRGLRLWTPMKDQLSVCGAVISFSEF